MAKFCVNCKFYPKSVKSKWWFAKITLPRCQHPYAKIENADYVYGKIITAIVSCKKMQDWEYKSDHQARACGPAGTLFEDKVN